MPTPAPATTPTSPRTQSLIVIWSGLIAGLLLIAYRSYVAGAWIDLSTSLETVKYVAALGVAALVMLLLLNTSRVGRLTVTILYLAGLLGLLGLALSSTGRTTAAVAGGCPLQSLVIEAAGTQYLEPPRFQVLLDGKQVAEIAVPSPESHSSTSAASLAEVKAAAATAKPFTVALSGESVPKTIEIRYINDQWGTPENPGDRNLFIKSVIVNGVKVPESQLKPDDASHGITDATGTALYENGSLWVSGPFAGNCR